MAAILDLAFILDFRKSAFRYGKLRKNAIRMNNKTRCAAVLTRPNKFVKQGLPFPRKLYGNGEPCYSKLTVCNDGLKIEIGRCEHDEKFNFLKSYITAKSKMAAKNF